MVPNAKAFPLNIGKAATSNIHDRTIPFMRFMTVRWRILALELASLFFIALMIAIMALALGQADRFVQRVDKVHERFEVIAQIDGLSSQYSGQIAEVLLLGRDQMSDLQTARLNMERAFARLTQITRDEISALGGADEIRNQLPDIENTRRMIELYHAIDLAASRALVLQRDGRSTEAMDVFQREVDFRLKNEFAALLDSALQDERNELGSELAGVEATRNTMLIVAGIIALLALVVGGDARHHAAPLHRPPGAKPLRRAHRPLRRAISITASSWRAATNSPPCRKASTTWPAPSRSIAPACWKPAKS